MNNHKIACAIIGVLTLAMLWGVNQVRAKAQVAKDDRSTAEVQTKGAEQQKMIAEASLQSVDKKTADLRKVYTEWLPHFQSLKNTSDGEQKIAEAVREGDVFLLSQKFKPKKMKDGFIGNMLEAELVVEDEYSKVINWLGTLEQKIPTCRISKCAITRGDRGNDIHVEMKVEVPVIKQ